MTGTTDTGRRANLLGSLWMIAAMAGFAIEDGFIKGASLSLPTAQILVLFGAGGAMVFGAMALALRERLLAPEILSLPMRIRVVFEVMGRLFYVLALALTPLSATTVILQATPVVVVAGAALVFGETVGWRRWTAIVVGLIGVLVIIQPGQASFSALSLLAVIGMLGFAGRDLASRAAPATIGTATLGFYGFLAIILAGVLFYVWDGTPFVPLTLTGAAFMTGAVLAGVTGYSSLMKAMRTGEVAAVTPFRYTRIIFGIGLGLIFFGETLTTEIVVGCTLIVLSGLFILWRGKKKGPPKGP